MSNNNRNYNHTSLNNLDNINADTVETITLNAEDIYINDVNILDLISISGALYNTLYSNIVTNVLSGDIYNVLYSSITSISGNIYNNLVNNLVTNLTSISGDFYNFKCNSVTATTYVNCNSLTSNTYVNCESGICNATWSCNKINVADDLYYPNNTSLQSLIDAKIGIEAGFRIASDLALGAAIASTDAIVTGLTAASLGHTNSITELNQRTYYIQSDYIPFISELGGLDPNSSLGNTYINRNLRIGTAADAPISLYASSGQISASKFQGYECNVNTLFTDSINSHDNGDLFIGSDDNALPRTIYLGDTNVNANCLVRLSHDCNIGKDCYINAVCRATRYDALTSTDNIVIGGLTTQIIPRYIFLGDIFAATTIGLLNNTNITGNCVVSGILYVGNSSGPIKMNPTSGVVTCTGLIANTISIGTTLNGTPIGYFTNVTSNIQAQLNLLAPIASPTFTGIPSGPTAAAGTTTTQLATCYFVQNQNASIISNVTLTGSTSAPTQTPANNTTSIATTAFVQNQANSTISNVTLTGLPMLTIDSSPVTTDNSYRIASTTFVKGQGYAKLDAPAFTGAVTFVGTLNTITPAIFAFLSGATSNIQTQINTLGVRGTANTWTGINTFSNTTDATSSIDGAVIISGGCGISKKLYVGSNFSVIGTSSMGTTNIAGITSITNTTGSSNWTTGALVVSGGVGITGALNTNSSINTNGIMGLFNTTDSTTTGNGSLVVLGGVGIAKNINVGGTATITGITTITNTTPSASYNTGALVVAGGVGISRGLYVTGDTHVNYLFFDPPSVVGDDNAYINYANTIGGSKSILRIVAQNDVDDHICLLPSGNVGIKTDNPSYNLDVLGTGRFTQDLKIDGTTNSTSTGTGAVIINGGTGVSKDMTIGGRITIKGTYNTNSLSQVVDGSDYCYMEYLRLNTTSDLSVFRINVGNDGFGGNGDNINLKPVGGVGIKTDTPAYELDVVGTGRFTTNLLVNGTTASTNTTTGSCIISGGCGIAGRLSVGGLIAGALGLTINGGPVTVTSTTTNIMRASTGITINNTGTGVITINTAKGDVNITAYEPDNTVTANVNITAGDAIVMSGATIKCNTQMIRSWYTVNTSSYTFTSIDAIPSVVWVTLASDIYIPAPVSSYYNGLVVVFRGVASISGFNIRISGGASRITARGSSVSGQAVLLSVGSSENYCAHLMFIDGYWFDTR